eukprot:4318810-Pyramimonas_sp.AAC.1
MRATSAGSVCTAPSASSSAFTAAARPGANWQIRRMMPPLRRWAIACFVPCDRIHEPPPSETAGSGGQRM